MKQLLPRFLLFISLLSLFSCTLTKRKYTGGYYVSWHSKAPETGVIKPAPDKHAIIKIAQTNSTLVNKEIEAQPEKLVALKIVQAIKYSKKELKTPLNISTNLLTATTYTTTPENEVQGQKIKPHHTAMSSPPLFGVLSISAALLSFIGDSAVFLSWETFGVLILFPIIAILLAIFLACLSLYKARNILHEIKENPNTGGIGWAFLGKILAIFGLIIVAISISFLIAISL